MLRQIAIMTGDGGVVLFQKQWFNGVVEEDKVGMLSGVLAAFEEFARQLMSMFVSYMEFGAVAAALVRDESTGLLCIVFYDVEDGLRYGRILASHLLNTFLAEYGPSTQASFPSKSLTSTASSTSSTPSSSSSSSSSSSTSSAVFSSSSSSSSSVTGKSQGASEEGAPLRGFFHNTDPRRFMGFGGKIPEAIRNAPRALLDHLVNYSSIHTEIVMALILFPDGTTVHSLNRDEIGLLANLQALLVFAAGLMECPDTPYIQIDLRSRTCHIHRVRDCSFVVISSRQTDPEAKRSLSKYLVEASQVLAKFLSTQES